MRRLVMALLLVCVLTASAWADETKYSLPVINATSDEPMNISTAWLQQRSTSTVFDVNLSNRTAFLQLPISAFLMEVSAKPVRWLENGEYVYRLLVADRFGNRVTPEYLFLVNATGQRLTLITPRNGGTNTADTSFVIESEFSSLCRWMPGDVQILDSNRFLLMNGFDSPQGPGTTHTLDDLYGALDITPRENQQVTLSVTCENAGQLTSRLFYITYLTQPPTLSASFNPNPIIDPERPATQLTVNANQEVWCTADEESVFGQRTIDNFRTVQRGTYTDTVVSNWQRARNVTIECENRIGLTATRNETLRFNYFAEANITVTSAQYTRNKAYNLTFTTTKSVRCTVTQGDAGWQMDGDSYRTTFRAWKGSDLAEGNTNLVISCNTGFQQEPTLKQFTVVLDTTKPTLTLTGRPNSCGLEQIAFSFNASDPSPGSGIGEYNYTIYQKGRTSEIVAGWTTTDDEDVEADDLELKNGTDYTVHGIAIDRAGNPSTPYDLTVRATDGTEDSCDREKPSAFIRTEKRGSQTYANLTCVDNVGCKEPHYCNVVPGVNQRCTVDTSKASQRYNGSVLIPQPSTMCCEVSDLNGNKASVRSNIFTNTTAPAGNCGNGIKDSLEDGVDCGGICVAEGKLCTVGSPCVSGVSCESGVCLGGLCAAPSCTDLVKNGAETGVDCGGSCNATCGTFNSCTTNADCSVGERCERSTCVPGDFEEGGPSEDIEDAEYEEPTYVEDAFGMINVILIVAGALCMLGGGAYILLYEEPKKAQPRMEAPPSFEEERPLVVAKPLLQQSEQAVRKKRRNVVKERVKDAIKGFDTPEELEDKENITHKDLEQAYDSFESDTFKETTKRLLADKKIEKHHIAIALADLASKKGADTDAIEDLRKEFDIKEEEK